MTLIKGLALDADVVARLGKQLRTACGSGGTMKNGVIEVQGDHGTLVRETLNWPGHHPKRGGG